MVFDVTILGIVLGFMVLANRLVAMLVTPLFEKYSWDKFWLMYPAWVLSGVLVWLSGANLFAAIIPSQPIGQILTAIVAGGGANLLHDLTDNKPTIKPTIKPTNNQITESSQPDGGEYGSGY